MDQAEQLVKSSLAEYERGEGADGRKVEKATLDAFGDELLAKYMSILDRPGAVVTRAYCPLAAYVYDMSESEV